MLNLWIHWIAAISFIGGMIFYFMIYHPAQVALNPSETDRFIKRVDQQFKSFRWFALMILLGTGVLNLLHGSDLIGMTSSYGGLLVIKLLLVMVVFGLMGVYDFVLPSKVNANSGAGGSGKQPAIHRISETQRWVGWAVILLCLGMVWVAMGLSAF